MRQKYEYKFVRLDAHASEYHRVTQEQASEGWRLVQIFAPGAGGLWTRENFCEVIFEREIVG